jgi:hypothetical protein
MLVTAVLGYVTWARSRRSRGVGLLEGLRLLIVTLVVITLQQPEWRETFAPTEKPLIVVLRDASASMETADLIDPTNPGLPARTRSEVASTLADPIAWATLQEDFEVLIQPFSGETAEGTDLGAALADPLDQQSRLSGVVLLSDGDWNVGAPPSLAATRLRMAQVPVFTVALGSETQLPDLEVSSFDVPTFGIIGKPLRLPFSLSSTLPQAQSINLTIITGDAPPMSRSVTIPAMGRFEDTILWTPQTVGDFSVALEIPTLPIERDAKNNLLSAPIAVRKEELRVLVIESYPRWEYRYLRNALERDPGVSVNCLLFHPDISAVGAGTDYLEAFPAGDKLATYDVIFLGDVGLAPGQLAAADVAALKKHVASQAAGLVLLPGFRGHQLSLVETELGDLFPVLMDPAQPRGFGSPTPGQFELTELGSRSLLTRLEDTESNNNALWSALPGFQWYAGVTRAKTGSEVLATHSSETNRYGRIPLIVTKTFGTGKILFMGTDGAWRWRKGVEDKYHYRFWGQVARWMAYQRNMASDSLMRLFYSPDRPRSGDTLTLNANVMSVGGEPLSAATVIVEVTTPSGKIESVRLQPGGEDQWGLFTSSYQPDEPGEHLLKMTCLENGATLETLVTVQGTALEQIGRPARYDVLEEIARLTRGEFLTEINLAAIQEKIAAQPAPEPVERRLRLWAHPLWIGAIILLLSVFWLGRKMIGTV